MNIPIAAISDRKLAFAMSTLFINLLETKCEDNFYEINALVTPDFPDEDINKIKSLEIQYKGQCSINIIKMDNRFDNINNKTGYIANACAYKFCLAEKLPQYDKILYLDTDILVFEDLSELFATNIENYYIAGVFSLEHYLNRRELIEALHIPNLDSYVNAGVLLFNLKTIRDNNIEPKLQKLVGTYKDSVDQHIFNSVCYGHIKTMPPKYNVTLTCLNYYIDGTAEVAFKKREILEVKENPVIFHYTGRYKPWNSYNLKHHLIWLRYYNKSPYKNELTLNYCPSGYGYTKQELSEKELKRINRKLKLYSFLYKIFKHEKIKQKLSKYKSKADK